MAWSCRSHSPPWSQIGQSSGWLISRNSITPSRALRTIGDLVLTTGGSPFGPGRPSRTPQGPVEPAPGVRRVRLGRALRLAEAEAAIAGDRQPFGEAETGDPGARRFRCL